MATTTTQRGRGTARSLRGFLADSAYASLGLGGATVELVRSIDRLRVQTPQQARAIGKQTPEQLRHLVQESASSTLGLPRLATREFYGLARRGRDLVDAIRTNQATREAVDQTRTARSRVKAAGTSIGKAAESAVQATERAATIVAARTEPTQRREIEVQPPKVKTRTASGRQATARRSAAARAPSPPREQAQTGPYEERTVEELQERARELGIEGRASMTKDELIKALREQRS
jgi:Rho termination factor, N-terminal domain